MKIDGAFAIVTGGANGIGKEITIALLEHGAKVSFIDINEAQGRKTEKELQEKYSPHQVTFIECDVTNKQHLKDALRKATGQNGGLDILCNNAGILNNEDWEAMINTNLTSLIQCTMIGLDLMDKTNGGHGGVILNMASLAGVIPYEFSPVYAATKHGVVGFTRSIAQKALEKGVRLNLVCPSIVDTQMTTSIVEENWVEFIKKTGCVTPDTVAKGFIQLIQEDSRNGEALRVTVQNGIEVHQFQEMETL